jgi:hypothetical protein
MVSTEKKQEQSQDKQQKRYQIFQLRSSLLLHSIVKYCLYYTPKQSKSQCIKIALFLYQKPHVNF